MANDNKALGNIKNRLNELESEVQQATEELSQAMNVYTEAVGGTAVGTHTAKDMAAASSNMKKIREQLSELENQIAIVNQVRKKATFEQLPIIRDIKRKKIEAAKVEYDEHVKRVQAKRNAFLLELAKTPQYIGAFGAINREAAEAIEGIEGIRELDFSVAQVYTVAPVGHSGLEALGVSEKDQVIAKNGSVPQWAKE